MTLLRQKRHHSLIRKSSCVLLSMLLLLNFPTLARSGDAAESGEWKAEELTERMAAVEKTDEAVEIPEDSMENADSNAEETGVTDPEMYSEVAEEAEDTEGMEHLDKEESNEAEEEILEPADGDIFIPEDQESIAGETEGTEYGPVEDSETTDNLDFGDFIEEVEEAETELDEFIMQQFELLTEANIAGECGKLQGTVFWKLDTEYVLHIYGEGEMVDWNSPQEVPWYPVADMIEGLDIENSVSGIGSYAFSACSRLKVARIG